MDWVDELKRLREERTPAVVVTLAAVRGHAPRNGGAKLVVSPGREFGTVGGGNLEATAIDLARDMLAAGEDEPRLLTLALSDRAATEYGVQCCGGEVTMLLEPVRVVPSDRDLRCGARRPGARPHPGAAADRAAPDRYAARDARIPIASGIQARPACSPTRSPP